MGQISFTLVPCVAGTYEPGKTSNNTVKLFLASQFNDEINFYATAPEGLRSNEMNRAAFVAGLMIRFLFLRSLALISFGTMKLA